jgi:hypothetical protein
MAPGARGASPWRSRWLWGSIAGALALILISVSLWVHLAPTPAVRFLIRLYVDPLVLKAELQAWGVWAPLVFIGIQALQVVVARSPERSQGSSAALSSASGSGSPIRWWA